MRRMELSGSDYVAHLGHHTEFTARFDPTASEEQPLPEGRFVVYPNPGNGQVWVSLEGELQGNRQCLLTLYDVQGRALKSEKFYAGRPQQFDWGDLPPGMYYYLIWTEDRRPQSGKIVIAR